MLEQNADLDDTDYSNPLLDTAVNERRLDVWSAGASSLSTSLVHRLEPHMGAEDSRAPSPTVGNRVYETPFLSGSSTYAVHSTSLPEGDPLLVAGLSELEARQLVTVWVAPCWAGRIPWYAG